MNYQLNQSEQEQLTQKVTRVLAHPAVRGALLFTGCAVLACAQASPFGQVASGASSEAVLIAKWIGIILCIFCGFGLMAGGPGAMAKASGLFLGLIFALFATPIVAWVQSL